MNLTLDESISLVSSIVQTIKNNDVEIILFPPFPFLKTVQDLIVSKTNFSVGAQNCSEYLSGEYTGEVSASIIKSIGCKYVLIGHSDRKQFSENSHKIRQRIHRALSHNLNVVLCIGESQDNREHNEHFEIIKEQINDMLSEFPADKTNSLIVAYEPIWAIGSGTSATPDQAQEMHAFIRKQLLNLFPSTVSESIPLLYGGSCNVKNSKELFLCPDIDGGLIGSASLRANDFCEIVKSF